MTHDFTGTETVDGGRRESVTAFFDSRADAQNALDRLRDEGLSDASLRLVEGGDGVTHGAARGEERKGFWRSLADLFIPEEDRDTYAEGLARGGYVVSVDTTAANRERILDILHEEGTVDIDEREASWRSEGWSGWNERVGDDGATRATDEGLGATAPDVYGGRIVGEPPRDAAAGLDRADAPSRTPRFGRRETIEGRSRVRSYVWDEPAPPDDAEMRSQVEIDDERLDDRDGRAATGTAGRGFRES